MRETRIPEARGSELTISQCDAGSGVPNRLVVAKGHRQPRECSGALVVLLELQWNRNGRNLGTLDLGIVSSDSGIRKHVLYTPFHTF